MKKKSLLNRPYKTEWDERRWLMLEENEEQSKPLTTAEKIGLAVAAFFMAVGGYFVAAFFFNFG